MDPDLSHPTVLVHASKIGNVGVVRLAGDMTAATAAALRTHLIDALGSVGPRLVVSLRGIHACDNAGILAVEAAANRAWRRGGWLRLIEIPDTVLHAYTAASRHPQTYTGLEDALRTR